MKNTLKYLEEKDVERYENEIYYNGELPVASDNTDEVSGTPEFDDAFDEIYNNELYKAFDGNAADMAACKCGYTACFYNEKDGTMYYFK